MVLIAILAGVYMAILVK